MYVIVILNKEHDTVPLNPLDHLIQGFHEIFTTHTGRCPESS